MPAMVSPSPTWAADSPTIWVKKTADPVMNVPSPRANSSDWTDEPASERRRRAEAADGAGGGGREKS